jgi:hypothetical protein
VVAGILPAVEYTAASPRASALSNVLLDGFTSAPVCGNDANCTGGGGVAGGPLAGSPAQLQRIANQGLPPQAAAALLAGLGTINGATTIPVYSPAASGGSGQAIAPGSGPGANATGGPNGGAPGPNDAQGGGFGNEIISCAGLRELAVLGQCAPGLKAAVVQSGNMFDDNPRYSTQPIASASSPAASANFSRLYLQAVLVKANSAATVEKVRTYLVTHTPESQSGTAARTFGEAVQSRSVVASTVQRLIDTAVILTLIVAGCSLAVSVGGSLVERKRPFTLLRVTGTPLATLYRVVLLEAVLPLVAATILAGVVAYVIATATVEAIAPSGTPVPAPGGVYYATIAAGLAGSLVVILTSLPLLRHLTGAAGVRFE